MIHELIFDFVNGKTKSFKFKTKEEADNLIEWFRDPQKGDNGDHNYNFSRRLNNTAIFAQHICSITYNSYPKSEEE